jgi:monoamine oxidase
MPMPEVVIIIGAGAAGLTAAIALGQAGFRVIILEARDRVGGRMFTKVDRSSNAAVELGAEFVHGKPPEIWDLIRAHHLKVTEMDGDDWCVRSQQLNPCDFFSEVEQILGRMNDGGPDESFADFLKRCCPEASPEAKEWALGYVQGFHAADPELVSVHSLVKGTRADEAIEGNRAFCIHGGYQMLLRVFEKHAADLGVSLRLNTVVESISWKKGHAEVAARNEAGALIFTAKRVLITLPLGVLQAGQGQPGTVRFAPPLPPEKLSALGNLEMGKVIRITLCFRDRFWKSLRPPDSKASQTLSNLAFLLSRDEWFPTWWTRQREELPILVGWAPFPSAQRLSGKSEGYIVEKALETLARLLSLEKNEISSRLQSAYLLDWQTDPFSRGAYSYVKVGGDTAEYDLGLPIENTLFFAGEATDVTGHNGTVHGAIASGKRAAKEIISAAG